MICNWESLLVLPSGTLREYCRGELVSVDTADKHCYYNTILGHNTEN